MGTRLFLNIKCILMFLSWSKFYNCFNRQFLVSYHATEYMFLFKYFDYECIILKEHYRTGITYKMYAKV